MKDELPKPASWKRRRLLRLASGLVFVGLFVFVGAIFASGPVTVPFLGNLLASQGTRGPVTLSVESASVDFTADDGIRIVIEDVRVDISGGAPVTLKLPRLEAPLTRSALWSGDIRFASLHLNEPQVTIALKGGPAVIPEISQLSEAVNRIGNVIDDQFVRRGLTSVTVSDGAFDITGPAPRSFTNINADVFRSPDGEISASARVGGRVTSWRLDFLRAPSQTGPGTRMAAVVNGITLAELLGPDASTAYGKGLRLPASAKLDSVLDEYGELISANAVARVQNGWFQMGRTLVAFDDVALSAVYRGPDKPIDIQTSHFIRGNTRIFFSGQIDQPTSDAPVWDFRLETEHPQVGPLDVREPPQMLDGATVQGRFNLAEKQIDISRFSVRSGKASATGVVNIQIGSDGPYLAIAVDGEQIPISLAKKVWPITLVPPARKWIIERIKAGLIETVSFTAAIRPPAFNHLDPDAGWSGDDMAMTMSFVDGAVAPVGDVAVVDGLSGTMTIENEVLTVKASGGTADLPGEDDVVVPETVFEIHNLPLRVGKIAKVETRLEGGNAEIGALLNAKPFEVLDRANLKTGGVTGSGVVDITASFPMERVIDMDDVTWKAVGRSEDFSDENPIMGHQIQNADLSIEADRSQIVISGNGEFDGLNADINLVVPLSGAGDPRRQDVVASVTADQLKARGIDLTAFLDGPMTVSAGKAEGGQNISIDLQETEVRLQALGWRKAKGVPASASFKLIETDDKKVVQDFELVTEGADIFGQIHLSATGELTEASFPRFQLRPGDDAQIDITRADSGRYDIIFSGKNFDGRGLIQSLRSPGGSQGAGDFADGARIAVDLDRMTGFNKRWMGNVRGRVDTGARGLMAADISGLVGGSSDFRFTLTSNGGAQQADGRFDDTGAMLAFLDLYKRMRGGRGTLSVAMADADSWVGDFKVRSLVITEDPAIQRISTTNLNTRDEASRVIVRQPQVNTAEGARGTASFETLDINFTREGDQMTISRGALQGNALGGTVAGTVDLKQQTLNLTGTFVPIYALNNFFSKIPLLGFALGGSTGEGLIGVTYRLSGSLSDPVLSVNPISAIAPGIFRRMFEFQPE
ncbi:AsmA-like C-terminal domain-containing protein [Labrenzia sp. R4_1]|uniref:AsmA-like C-terminal domain-containing protein n=1 Tax=Labrenzia sp. R4_1 TaxID=2821106 RepID=UPI001ADCC26D|nr:AsmA-like C-terminal domain-containing protein [Labrenzia sp. R4_1]MBO9427061.1 AsmA-like C-terminal domain-containing protein [Labrenzia sp. R4_1]